MTCSNTGGDGNDHLVGATGADAHSGGDGFDKVRRYSCAEGDTNDGTVERGIRC